MRALILFVLLAAACGGPADCPNDLPASCPSPMPSYQNGIRPIIQAYCLKCHSPGGQEATIDFTSHQNVFTQRGPILTQIYSCRMPLAGEATPTTQERATFLGWLVCGSPNN